MSNAVDANKPVIAFLHKDPLRLPAAMVEKTDDGRNKLKSFRELLQQKVCKYWETPAELGSVVSRSLVRLTKTTPAVGWIRADEATEALAAPEVLRLRKRIEELEGRLEEARSSAPEGSDKLAQTEDFYSNTSRSRQRTQTRKIGLGPTVLTSPGMFSSTTLDL